MRRPIPMALCALAVVSCQAGVDDAGGGGQPAVQSSTDAAPRPAGAPPASSTPARDPQAPPPALSAIRYDEFNELIPSGAGCSFTTAAPDTRLVMVSSAEIEADARAQGVIRLDGKLLTLRSQTAGGFERLREGAVLTDEAGVSVTVDRAPGPGQPDGIESTIWPATLTVRAVPDREARYEGRYSCGV